MDQKDVHFTGERKADRESVFCFETWNESSAVELIRIQVINILAIC